ncbi:MAG: hypothetical protein KC441_00580 [Anaerolineales bacterium]|nr:hypothetical protein [Anaerolineales bacterium]
MSEMAAVELSEQLTFISDPGHGWLKVPLGELTTLGIQSEITTYSFVDGRFVYLEEDQDAGTYLVARRAQGYPDPQFDEQYVEYFDRSQRCYSPPVVTP